MSVMRKVITASDREGHDYLGLNRLAVKLVDESIVSGSLLTVESNHFGIVKTRGAVLSAHETGQYELKTDDKPLLGSLVQGFFAGNNTPWAFEILYVNRAKLLLQNKGVATSREMAEVSYVVDYYIHIDNIQDALALITHMPFSGSFITSEEIAAYAGPAIEQAINQIIQVTPLESINEKAPQLVETVTAHLSAFLKVYGISLHDLKVLVLPKDDRMRALISLKAFGASTEEALRYYLAFAMAEKGLLSAPNAAAGVSFQIGGTPLLSVPAVAPDVAS